jgi:hypothetical protein
LYRLKALVALPKTSGAIARAIAKEYPNMRALLNAYLDSSKSVSVSFSTWYTFGFGIFPQFVNFTVVCHLQGV